MSLLTSNFVNAHDFSFLENTNYTFSNLFQGNDNIIDAGNLILPSGGYGFATYYLAFNNAHNLVRPPVFCCQNIGEKGMFQAFAQAYSLTGIVLSATTLDTQCYHQMIYECSPFVEITVGFTDWNNGDST